MTVLERLLAAVAVLAVVVAAVALGFVWHGGMWNLVFPTASHDAVAPALPDELPRPAVLVFSKTNGFRHRDAIPAGRALFEGLARARGGSVFATENGAVFNEALLGRFDAVVFHCATGDMLSDEQEAAFTAWLEGGGGWIGIHAAGDGSHAGWRWYTETLIGSDYRGHPVGPQFQDATLTVEDRDHPATAALPATWVHNEEWYSWQESARATGMRVLVSVDETTYSPRMRLFGRDDDLSMGDHPVVWSRCVGRGRAFYSALGHRADAYTSEPVVAMLEGALAWVLGSGEAGCR